LKSLIETVDLYPTLAELCDVEYPDDLDGTSMIRLLRNPESKGKTYARSYYYRNQALGKTLRTEKYRIVRWATEKDSTVAVELYDHTVDPDENINIASEQKIITDSLLKQLKAVKFIDGTEPFQSGWE